MMPSISKLEARWAAEIRTAILGILYRTGMFCITFGHIRLYLATMSYSGSYSGVLDFPRPYSALLDHPRTKDGLCLTQYEAAWSRIVKYGQLNLCKAELGHFYSDKYHRVWPNMAEYG